MSDLPNLDAARWHAQNPKCHRGVGMLSCSRANDGAVCGPCFQAGHIRAALAVVDALTARLAEAEAENRRLRDVLGWTNQECPGKCGAAAFDALAAKVTPFLLPCPTCGYNGVPGTTHSTSCLYPEAKVTP